MTDFIDNLLDQVRQTGAYGLRIKNDERPVLTFSESPRDRQVEDAETLSTQKIRGFLASIPSPDKPNRDPYSQKSVYKGFRIHPYQNEHGIMVTIIDDSSQETSAETVNVIDNLLERVKQVRAHGLYLKSGNKPMLTFNEGPRYRDVDELNPLNADEINEFASTLPGYYDNDRNQRWWESFYKGFRVHITGTLEHTHVVFIDNAYEPGRSDSAPTNAIEGFQGEYRFLSNFWIAPASYAGVEYKTAEHAYQAAKFDNLYYRRQIGYAERPHDAKIMGQTTDFPVREGWENGLKFMAMSEVVASKFFTASKFYLRGGLADLLIDTGDALLVETNRWHDQVWGDCNCGRSECEAPGKNMLGQILMTVRASLKASR